MTEEIVFMLIKSALKAFGCTIVVVVFAAYIVKLIKSKRGKK